MVKKNNEGNSSITKNYAKNESNNGFNDNIADEKFINDLLYIKNAISNKELVLSSGEEKKLKEDLEFLSNYFNVKDFDDSDSVDYLDDSGSVDSLGVDGSVDYLVSDSEDIGDKVYKINYGDIVSENDIFDKSIDELNDCFLHNIIFLMMLLMRFILRVHLLIILREFILRMFPIIWMKIKIIT